MASNRRKFPRRAFNYGARIVAIDGSWGHDCVIMDVSATGARLETSEPVKLPNEFVLVLTKGGKAVRKCRLVWNRGKEIGVTIDAVTAGVTKREPAVLPAAS